MDHSIGAGRTASPPSRSWIALVARAATAAAVVGAVVLLLALAGAALDAALTVSPWDVVDLGR
jgi:hypothetical protein